MNDETTQPIGRPVGPDDPTLVGLLARLRDPDNVTAFDEFAHRYGRLIALFAGRHGLRDYEREDAVQETFEALLRRLPDFEYKAEGSFRAYLRTVVRHVAADIARRRDQRSRDGRRGRELSWNELETVAEELLSTNEAEDAWEEEWRRYHTERALLRLRARVNEDYWEVFRARYVDGWPTEQIAKHFGLTENNVYKMLSRCRSHFEELIEQQRREED